MLQESVSGMSPVPEPMQSRKGEPGGNDEEELNPPSGLALGQAVSSSDDEHDSNDTENETHNGYIPLPQYNDVASLDNFLYLKIFGYFVVSTFMVTSIIDCTGTISMKFLITVTG